MAAAFQLQTSGQRQVEAEMAAIAARGENLSPLLDAYGLHLETTTIERFDNEETPDGAKWSPSLRARTEGGKTLTDNAILKNSITYVSGKDFVEVGSNIVYARIHDQGGKITPKNGDYLTFRLPGNLGFRKVASVEIPQRQFLGLSAENIEEFGLLADDFFGAAAPGLSS